jgi:hypothetical protein
MKTFPEHISKIYIENFEDLGITTCAVCGKIKNEMIKCKKCNYILYCSKEHQSKDKKIHEMSCPYLQELNEDDNQIFTQKEIVKGLKNFKINNILDSPTNLFMDNSFGRLISNYLTFPLTLEYILKKHEIINPKTIHIIGASFQETQYFGIWKEISKNIEKLIFIGPELPKNYQTTHNLFKMKYNEYVSSNSYEKPDLIIGYNMGLSVPDYDWKESIEKMYASTIIITSHSKDEILMDFCEIEANLEDSKIKVYPQLNPYSSKQIYQSGTLANDIYKKNMYYMIIENE